jgi:hypothetical protein
MPTVRLLRTTGIDTYDVFDLTSAILASKIKKDDITVQIDGIVSTFSTANSPSPAVPFVAGTLELIMGGALQNGVPGVVITEHPGTGTFDLNFVPIVPNGPYAIRFIAA